MITDKLKDGYLVEPRVTVSVITYREFYISGEVQKPGGYPYQPGLTLDRAIALAGGLTERASLKRVTIVRGLGETRVAEKATIDTAILPGDTITIAQGFF
ncbi:SLBB domain protein [compost metagenome]